MLQSSWKCLVYAYKIFIVLKWKTWNKGQRNVAPITQQYLKTHPAQLCNQEVCSSADRKQGFIFQGDSGQVVTGRTGDIHTHTRTYTQKKPPQAPRPNCTNPQAKDLQITCLEIFSVICGLPFFFTNTELCKIIAFMRFLTLCESKNSWDGRNFSIATFHRLVGFRVARRQTGG